MLQCGVNIMLDLCDSVIWPWDGSGSPLERTALPHRKICVRPDQAKVNQLVLYCSVRGLPRRSYVDTT